MRETEATQRRIIEAAINASTYADALALSDMIESDIGASHQRPVGDRFNNYGLMASSGSYEYKALEPVTNQQDAVLERLAARKWGTFNAAPYSTPSDAAKDLLGGLTYQEQADQVGVSFRESDPPTRTNRRLTIVYRDQGCGLEPSEVPTTIFALGSSHKTSSNWHQGAFGIGGASTYRNARAVVLVSRRAPEMHPSDDRITVAVVFWETHGKGQSAYYLVTSDWDTNNAAEPWSAPATACPEFDFGTQLSLISYGVEGFHRSRSGDERSFDMVLNTRLFQPIIPVRFRNDITRSKNEYLRGLHNRLTANPSAERMSDDELLLYTFEGHTYKLPVTYYVFPTGDTGTRRRFVAKGHALAFTSNGQVHHHWTPPDFRNRTKLNKLYDRILVIVETDGLPIELRTGIFTPDRSQLLANEPALQLEDQVADFLNNWNSLVEVNSQLVREAIAGASQGRSTLDVGRRISAALKIKGFGFAGQGTSGGGAKNGGGGPRPRKKVETYPDPTTLEGPDKLVVEDGKVRHFEYMLNAVDDFFDSGRGALTFETDHPTIEPGKHLVIGKLRDGYVRVQLQVPEGADEGEFKLVVHLSDWHRSGGGIGNPFAYTTTLSVVDEIPPKGGGAGTGTGTKGADGGPQVAVIWSTPESQGGTWNNSVPGNVDELDATDLATREEYSDLAKLGNERIPTIILNSTYSPYKSYVSARARDLTAAGASDATDRYAVGVGLGLMLLYADQKSRATDSKPTQAPEDLLIAQQAVARAVLFMMPAFDDLARETGVES